MKISLFSDLRSHSKVKWLWGKNLHSGREKPRGTFKMLVESWNTCTVLDTLDHKNVQNTRKVDLFSVQFDRFDTLATLDCPAVSGPFEGSTASEAESMLVVVSWIWAQIWKTKCWGQPSKTRPRSQRLPPSPLLHPRLKLCQLKLFPS